MKKNPNILICPLEWGLGHAGRMIPLVKELIARNANVFIAIGDEYHNFFQQELPNVSLISFKGFTIKYSGYLPQYLVILLKLPVLFWYILLEHNKLKKLIEDYGIDMVISDGRIGLWNRKIRTVYITHQILIPFPHIFRSLEWIGAGIHRYFINKYTYCFIPDLPGEINLSGRLTHNLRLPGNARFIGLLSRFDHKSSKSEKTEGFNYNSVILSGPEPQKGIFRQKLLNILGKTGIPTIILEGKPEKGTSKSESGNFIFYNHLPTEEMEKIVTFSQTIITRSGYTMIMELVSLERTALVVPTPGQTEQEYLASYLSEKGWFRMIRQEDLIPGISISGGKAPVSQNLKAESRVLLERTLDDLLNKQDKESDTQQTG